MSRAPAAASPYARLVLDTMPQACRIGLALGFVRTFGVPEVATVLHGTGRLSAVPGERAKATGVAMFALIGHGPGSAAGRRVVEELRRLHDRPDITPELMHYVLACFTLCPLRLIDGYGPRPVSGAERAAAFAFHRELADALGLPPVPQPDLPALGSWMRDFEERRFAPSAAAHALWRSTGPVLAARLPAAPTPLAGVLAAALLDDPLRAALGVRHPPAPVRALAAGALRRGLRTT
ncbi:hypothetical protein GCM10009665_76010 [Kitasatospora nipponensis]|uniref:ER-bound oxygenase mpaB/mpaB'/Rubber oxygenase catalytic domain-containing protein n=1 Tax=Kitasatospora nipponensis TaxID=258049 RepID=A0ABN1T8T3_9ACTN